MANMCENRMTVCGDKAQIEAFIQAVKTETSVLSFSTIVPSPSAKEGISLVFWRLDNWGAKWDCSEATVETEMDGTNAIYRFLTAWTAPSAFYRALADRFPSLSFECYAYEPMMDYWYSFAYTPEKGVSEGNKSVWGKDRVEKAIKDELCVIGIDPESIDLSALRELLTITLDIDNYDLSEYPEAEFIIDGSDEEIRAMCEKCAL